jgi:hypothetical protein
MSDSSMQAEFERLQLRVKDDDEKNIAHIKRLENDLRLAEEKVAEVERKSIMKSLHYEANLFTTFEMWEAEFDKGDFPLLPTSEYMSHLGENYDSASHGSTSVKGVIKMSAFRRACLERSMYGFKKWTLDDTKSYEYLCKEVFDGDRGRLSTYLESGVDKLMKVRRLFHFKQEELTEGQVTSLMLLLTESLVVPILPGGSANDAQQMSLECPLNVHTPLTEGTLLRGKTDVTIESDDRIQYIIEVKKPYHRLRGAAAQQKDQLFGQLLACSHMYDNITASGALTDAFSLTLAVCYPPPTVGGRTILYQSNSVVDPYSFVVSLALLSCNLKWCSDLSAGGILAGSDEKKEEEDDDEDSGDSTEEEEDVVDIAPLHNLSARTRSETQVSGTRYPNTKANRTLLLLHDEGEDREAEVRKISRWDKERKGLAYLCEKTLKERENARPTIVATPLELW